MFKIVPKTNNLYEMSINGEVRRKDGSACTLTSLNNEPAISLEMYGRERTVTIEWLRLITHFEVDLKAKDLFNIYFVDIYKWIYSNSVNKTMLFYGRPLEYKPGFRIIPEYTRYAISQSGEVFDTECNVLVPSIKETNRYITIKLYAADKGIYKNLLLHRLVALAWVKNPDHLKYYLVNHKDSNKHNPHCSNLEWTDHKGNMDHAYDNGLRSDNTPCKIRNVETNEVTTFCSLREACEFMKVSNKSYKDFIRLNTYRLINAKYQIKLLDDDTLWPDAKHTGLQRNVRLKITVTDKDNNSLYFNGMPEVAKHFGFKNTIVKKRSILDSYARRNNLKLTYEDIPAYEVSKKPIQAYEISTNKIYNFNSMFEASKYLDVKLNTIKHTIFNGETFVTNGYAYRYKTNKKWSTNFSEAINRPKCILAINKNGNEYECDSIRIAEKLTKVNRKAIKRCLHGIMIQSDWHFKYK